MSVPRIPFLVASILALAVLSCQKNQNDVPDNGIDSTNEPDVSGDYGIAYYTTYGKNIVAYDLSKQKMLWSAPIQTAEYGAGFAGGDLVYNEGRIYQSGLYSASAVDASNGKAIWLAGFAGPYYQRQNAYGHGPVVVDSILYCTSFLGGGEHGLNAINKITGKMIWQVNLSAGLSYPGRNYIQPIVHKDKIYGIAQDDSHHESNIVCCNRYNGNIIWTVRYAHGYATAGSLIKDDSLLLVGCEGNTFLSAFNLNSGKNEWTFNIKGSSTFSSGRMFLKGDKLYAYDYWKQTMFVVDIPSQTATELPYFNSAFANTYPNDIYLMDADYIKKLNADNQQVAWSWESPLKAFNDSTRSGNSYNYMYDRFVVSDKYLYSQVAVFPNTRADSLKIVTSVYILDIFSGKVVKKLDFPRTFEDIWTNRFTINCDGKGY